MTWRGWAVCWVASAALGVGCGGDTSWDTAGSGADEPTGSGGAERGASVGAAGEATAGTGGSVNTGARAGSAGGAGATAPDPPPGCEEVLAFSDPAVEAAVRDAAYRTSGDLYFEDVYWVSELFASEAGISDLTGLECLTGLTHLGLVGNSVSDLSPLSELISLQFLDLQHNSVSDLSPLSGLTELSTLLLNNNQISNLSPLVANSGLGAGDVVFLTGPDPPAGDYNPIDCTAQAENIDALLARGVGLLVAGCT